MQKKFNIKDDMKATNPIDNYFTWEGPKCVCCKQSIGEDVSLVCDTPIPYYFHIKCGTKENFRDYLRKYQFTAFSVQAVGHFGRHYLQKSVDIMLHFTEKVSPYVTNEMLVEIKAMTKVLRDQYDFYTAPKNQPEIL